MSDNNKKWQRNIRIPPALWDYVKSQAPKGNTLSGDCSSVIRKWIIERMTQDGVIPPGDH